MFSYLVLQPTRVNDKSKTLIGIFYNSLAFTTVSGNITHSIFDHSIQFVALEDFIILKVLSKIDRIIEILINDNDVNEIFNVFLMK